MARNAKDAIAWGRAQITDRSRDWTGWCLVFVRSCFGVGAVFPSAIAAWDNAKKKHHDPSSKVPRGVPVFWRGGRFGHIAISLGNGKCISTDARRRGWPDVVTIDSITQSWGFEFLGWTEDLNGVTVYTPPERRTPNITAALAARTRAKRVEALKAVIEGGNKTSQKAAQQWIDAIDAQVKAQAQADKARAILQKQERV